MAATAPGRAGTEPATSCWVLIPIKAPGTRKTRLAHVLDGPAREALVERMLGHVIATARSTPAFDRVIVVGEAGVVLPSDVSCWADGAEGLSPSLAHAASRIAALPDGERPDRLVVLAADLPCLSVPDCMRLAQVAADTIAIATDRHGSGTNALSLPTDAVEGFAFRYGTGSRAAHTAAAAALGWNAETIRSPGLEKDVDLPPDLSDAEHLIKLKDAAMQETPRGREADQ